MNFKVLKSSFDGISGDASSFKSIDEVLREISYHKGWRTLDELHGAIRRWADNCRPGDVFTTQVTAIVAVAVSRVAREDDICHHCDHEGLDYDELEPAEDGDIEQRVSCPGCGARWMDVFTLSDQRELEG